MKKTYIRPELDVQEIRANKVIAASAVNTFFAGFDSQNDGKANWKW